jgi:serine/threonine protein kinase
LASFKQVSKYCPRGSLVKYLKGLSETDAARVDALKMIHEISEGMVYLHKREVLHGDLKVRIPAVKTDPLVKRMTLLRLPIYLLTMTRVALSPTLAKAR